MRSKGRESKSLTQQSGKQAAVKTFRVVQPYGRNEARECTVISEHPTAADAFAETDRLSVEMVRTGAPSDAVELIVLTDRGELIARSDAQ